MIARRFAAQAAKEGKPSFPLAVSEIARQLDVSDTRAGKIRANLVKKGVLVMTAPHNSETNESARFCWALEANLPTPPMSSSGPGSDLDDDSVF